MHVSQCTRTHTWIKKTQIEYTIQNRASVETLEAKKSATVNNNSTFLFFIQYFNTGDAELRITCITIQTCRKNEELKK